MNPTDGIPASSTLSDPGSRGMVPQIEFFSWIPLRRISILVSSRTCLFFHSRCIRLLLLQLLHQYHASHPRRGVELNEIRTCTISSLYDHWVRQGIGNWFCCKVQHPEQHSFLRLLCNSGEPPATPFTIEWMAKTSSHRIVDVEWNSNCSPEYECDTNEKLFAFFVCA